MFSTHCLPFNNDCLICSVYIQQCILSDCIQSFYYNVCGENLKLQITKFSLNANRKDASHFTDRCPRYSSDSHQSLFDHKVTIAESDQHFEQEPKVNEEHPILLAPLLSFLSSTNSATSHWPVVLWRL